MRVFNDPHRIRTLVAGRRFGKTRLATYELLVRTLSFQGKTSLESPEVVLGVLPTLQQAKKVLWQPLVNLAETELFHVVKNINKSEYRIDFKGSKPSIIVSGANDQNGDRLRGLRVYFILCDEYQDWKSGIFETVVLPAMSDTKGSRALITGTPKGKKNTLYEMFQMCEKLPDEYASFNMPTSTNPTIPRAEIQAARLRLPPKLFRQEYEASFLSFDNQFYTELSEENLVNYVPNSFDLVVMGCDWGDINPAIVVIGRNNGVWYYLEGWQNNTGQVVPEPTFDSQALRLASRWNVHITYCDPSRPASILRMRTMGAQNSVRGLQQTVAGFNAIAEGINQVHSLIYQRKLLFPTAITSNAKGYVSGKDAYELMMSYHRKTAKDGTILDIPAEGQNDHLIDAIRYALAVPTGTNTQ
ncbi:terminase large subunit domain-containing protein [Floridanema aerugineum]|uniref:Terminase large subunit domain-containing protein n=1 Tax=Floridaenema aerugineum BLCC-F46 TaxID=3153654 RepID=A0ABV4X2A0_9CYAN